MLLILLLFSVEFAPAAMAQTTPTGLRATAASSSVTITWNSQSGASSYDIYRSLTSGGEGSTPYATGVSGSATSYTNSSLTSGTTYYYTVAEVVSGTVSSQSNEAAATPGSTALTAPLLKGVGSSGQVSLAWTSVAGATSYNIYRTSSAGSSMIQVGLTGNTYTDTGLTNTITYTYTVYGVSTNGQGTGSNTVSILPGATALAAPHLAATEASTTSLTLAWSSVTGASSYNLYRSTVTGGEGSAPYKINVSSGMTDSGLSTSTTYYYTVAAVGSGGEGAASNEANATTGVALLPAPVLKGVGSSGQAALTWSSVTGATTYDIYRVAGSGSLTPYQTGISATTFTDTGLSNTTSYSYAVYAVSSNGQGTASNTVAITPGTATLPALLLSAFSSGTTSITVNWSTNSSATSYNLYRSTTSGGEGSAPYQANISSFNSSLNNTGLTNGVTYYYKIAPVNAGGEGAMSNEASATAGATALAAPILKGVGSTGQVALAWSSVTGASTYNLYRSSGGSVILYQAGLSTTTFTDTGLTNSNTYTYAVYAVGSGGQGTESNTVAISPGGAALPATVMWASGVSGQTYNNLYWTLLNGANTYDLYRSTTSGGEGATPYKVGLSDLSGSDYQDSGLTSGTTYYYQVSAVGAAGEGPLSNEASAKAGTAPPAAPTGFSATVAPNNGKTITLAWTAVTGATSYDIFRAPNGGPPYEWFPYQFGVATNSFVDYPPLGQTFTYEVGAVNAGGLGSFSSPSATVTLYGFGLNPNPATITVTRGTIGALSIQATPSGGYTQTIGFTGTGLPTGVTGCFYPGQLTFMTQNGPYPYSAGLPSQFNYAMTSTNVLFAVLSTAAIGTYTINVTGTSTGVDGFTWTVPVTLIIN